MKRRAAISPPKFSFGFTGWKKVGVTPVGHTLWVMEEEDERDEFLEWATKVRTENELLEGLNGS